MKRIILAAAAAFFICGTAYAASNDLMDLNATTAPVISCSDTSSRVALSNPNAPNIEIYNSGSDPAFLVYGSSTVSATFPTNAASAGHIVAGGAIVTYMKAPTATHVACIMAAGKTATVYVSTAKGE